MTSPPATPDELTAPFWALLSTGVLARPVCDECGLSFFTPQVACPSCRSERWSYVPSTGRGVVYSHTTIHRPPEPVFEAPYVLALVDVDEGWSLLTRLVGPVPDGSLIGMAVAVEPTPDPTGADRMLPTFRLRPDDQTSHQ